MDTMKIDGKEGAALLSVLLLVLCMGLISGSIIRTAYMESRMNRLNLRIHEAQNAAEALQEYATADVINRFKNDPSLSGSDLRNATTSVAAPASAAALFSGTNVVLGECDVTVSNLNSGSFGFVPSNQDRNDPLAGKYAFTRSIAILTKAGVEPVISSSSAGYSYAYAYQEFELRDAPLFTHAIFYNMDLVVAPGPDMSIHGPVHSNSNMAVESSGSLHFNDKVTVGGDFYVGHKMSDWDFHTGSYDADSIYFKDDAGNSEPVYLGGGRTDVSNYLDSRHSDWTEEASQTWGGMLQDASHGVPVLNPVSIDNYVPNDPNTIFDEKENHAYALIEPLLPVGHVDRKSDSTRLQKYAMKAGLLLDVVVDGTTTSGYKVRAYKQTRSTANSELPDLDIFGDPTLVEVDLPTGLVGDSNAAMDGIEVDGEPEEHDFTNTGGWQTLGGFYDRRQKQVLDIVSIDIGRLKDLVENDSDWDDSGTSSIEGYAPQFDWNGVVYVQFPIHSNSGGRTDKIVLADTVPVESTGTDSSITPGIALALIDGGALPNPSYVSNPGLTIVTNAAMYVVGHYNSDNDTSGSDSANATDAGEVPAAVVADSVTLLSSNWAVDGIGRTKSHAEAVNFAKRPAAETEWAMAIMAGYSPADPTTEDSSKNWGGGVQNLPRFLEYWRTNGNAKVKTTIRGSLVSLYESELQTRPYNLSGSDSFNKWFRAPERNWGFSDLFAANNMPPGTPSVRHPRVTNLEFLSADKYASLIQQINDTGEISN